MIVHTNDVYSFTAESACTTPLAEPASCEEAVTRTDKSSGSVVWILAAFAPGTSPALASVYFGIVYDTDHLDPTVAYAPCGPPGTIEVADQDWPDSWTGTTVGFSTPIQSDRMIPFYVFVIDNPSAAAGALFGTSINPLGGYAAFYDDAYPPYEDRCTRFGGVRWYEEGGNTCPVPPEPGGCCLPNTTCLIVAYQSTCDALQGVYLGDGSTCEAPCGACCYWQTTTDRRCVVTTASDCEDDSRWDAIKVRIDSITTGSCWSGADLQCATDPLEAATRWYCFNPQYEPVIGACCKDGVCIICDESTCTSLHGVWVSYCPDCDPDPCPYTPTQQTSWGAIKSLFR